MDNQNEGVPQDRVQILTDMRVVAVQKRRGLFFINTAADTGDGILAFESRCAIPILVEGQPEPTFAAVYTGFSSNFGDEANVQFVEPLLPNELPVVGTRVVCVPRRRGPEGKIIAYCWCPDEWWQAALRSYLIIEERTGTSKELEVVKGIFTLSTRYASDQFESSDGTIWTDGNVTYRIEQLDANGTGHVPSRDPRVPCELLTRAMLEQSLWLEPDDD